MSQGETAQLQGGAESQGAASATQGTAELSQTAVEAKQGTAESCVRPPMRRAGPSARSAMRRTRAAEREFRFTWSSVVWRV